VGEGAATRPRKPTPAERRDKRAAVEDVAEVLDAAARLLEARPRTVAEVRRRLVRDGYRADLVDAAVARMAELGYLDDAAFARSWIESRDRAAPRGEHALRRELALKGVDRVIVDGVLEARRQRVPAGEATDVDEAAAERLLTKKLPSFMREPDPRRRRQKAYALLARNGFAPDVCSAVTRRALDDAAADGSETE
jgi:regulatory protein